MLIFILPTLIFLMFGLGLNLSFIDFKRVASNQRAIATGLMAQLFLLPLAAYLIGALFNVSPLFHAGLILIALCPGGVTSNTFTLIARGDVALSVTLTIISSALSVLSIPLVFALWMPQYLAGSAGAVASATPRIILQILITTILPMGTGMILKNCRPEWSVKGHDLIRKVTPPMLLISVLLYFFSQREVIIQKAGSLLIVTLVLAAVTMILGALLSRAAQLPQAMRRTIIIETGMQNAAQAIAIGANTALVNDTGIAIPAIIYALAMNIACFVYAYIVILRNR
jgi:BASS family bile acid:Na+ symporter